MYENKTIDFIPRHGKKHSIPPHKINYRANIYAMILLTLPMVVMIPIMKNLKLSILDQSVYIANI